MAGNKRIGVISPENPYPVSQQLLKLNHRTRRIADFGPPSGEVCPGSEHMWVIGAEDPELVGEQDLEVGNRLRHVARV